MKKSRVQCVIELGGVVLRSRVYVIVIYISYIRGREGWCPWAIYMRDIYRWFIYSTVRHVTFVSGSSFIRCRSSALGSSRAL